MEAKNSNSTLLNYENRIHAQYNAFTINIIYLPPKFNK